MTGNNRVFDLVKLVFAITIAAFLTSTTIAQKNSRVKAWQTYSPDGARFSIRVPSAPLAAQGHIFDPTDNSESFQMIQDGLRSDTYNFEISKKGKRQFLVSVLAVQFAKKRTHRFVTDSEVDAINSVIGDDIEHSKVLRRATKNGEESQWSYKKKGSMQAEQESDDGLVYVKRSRTFMVITVVDYDYAKPGSDEIKTMLGSLRIW